MRFGKRVTARSSMLAMIFTIVFAPLGCEKPKPTVGDQVGNAIDNTIEATDNAVTQSKDAVDQARRDVSQQARDLRDELKKAVDDHLSSGGNQ